MSASQSALQQMLYGDQLPQSTVAMGDTTGLMSTGAGQTNPLMLDWNQLGTVGKLGVVSQGLGAFSNLANLYAGFKALSLQKKQFEFAKDAWNKNYANQVKDYENTLKDRWAARRASAGARGGSYENMNSWVGNRALTGTLPASHSGG